MRVSKKSEPTQQLSYSSMRPTIKDGDIILFKGRHPVSRIIRWVTRSEYSHAGIVAWWHERLLVLEATGPGVIATPLSRVVARYNGALELWTTDAGLDRDAVVVAAQLELGKEFATWALARALRKIVFGIKKKADPWRPPEKLICSQYVSYSWRAGGIDLADDEPDEFTTPGHIARASVLRRVGSLCLADKAPAGKGA